IVLDSATYMLLGLVVVVGYDLIRAKCHQEPVPALDQPGLAVGLLRGGRGGLAHRCMASRRQHRRVVGGWAARDEGKGEGLGLPPARDRHPYRNRLTAAPLRRRAFLVLVPTRTSGGGRAAAASRARSGR